MSTRSTESKCVLKNVDEDGLFWGLETDNEAFIPRQLHASMTLTNMNATEEELHKIALGKFLEEWRFYLEGMALLPVCIVGLIGKPFVNKKC